MSTGATWLAATTIASSTTHDSSRWQPRRKAFGDGCSWPTRSRCPNEREKQDKGGSAINELLGMYATWNACSDHAAPKPARNNELVEVARMIHPLSKWHEGYTTG